MQLGCFGVNADRLDECLYRLVRLLVHEEIEPPEIGARQVTGLDQQVLDVDACREPAQTEEQRKRE